jgi:tetratricopeptide (TPR) repeat protein
MEFPMQKSSNPVDSLTYWEEELARLDKESPMFWLQKARLAWVNHKQTEALFWYEKVRALVTEMVSIQYFRPEVLYNLGFLYACVSQYEKALETYEEFTDLFGADPHVFHQTIKLYAITGQLEEILKNAKSPPRDLYKLPPEKKIELSKILEHVVKPTDPEACSLCIDLLEKS